eukprot:386950-Pleurochrysis_carterae.AAC.1
MAGVHPNKCLSLARAKSGQWLNILHDEVLLCLQALGWDKTERVIGPQEVPTDLHQGRLWNQFACLRYLQEILLSEQEPMDDAWVTKGVQEAMMPWHSNESRHVTQEVLVPGGDSDDFPASNRPWKGGQVKHIRLILPDAMSMAARRAFILGVPVSDVRGRFGLQLDGYKAALEGLVDDTGQLTMSLC